MPGQAAARQRAVGRHGDMILRAELCHLPLLLPEDQVIVALDGDKFREAFLFRQSVCLRELIRKAVGNADIPGLSGLYHPVQPVHDIVQRGLIIPHVINIEIHMVHAEIFQAGIDHPLDVHLSGHARFDLLRRARQKFGGHHNAVPFREIFKRPAKILFAGAALVADGRIEKVHAKLQPPPDNLPGMLLVDGPAVLSVPRVAESHTSHTDAGHLQFGISKSGILHLCSS